jgi:DNA-binding transcriptional LysR family regulator
MLDLHLLRQYVAVAELEHVGRAAEALHMSQSPLSRQIMHLENQLGISLFEREKKRLRLTRHGTEILLEARSLLAFASRIEARARRLATGQEGTLVVGYVDGAVYAGVIDSVLRRYKMAAPKIAVELRAMRSLEQIDALRRREIDCGFLYNPPADRASDLGSKRMSSEKMVLAIPRGHPLSRKRRIHPSDLDRAPWIDRPPSSNPAAHARFLQACTTAGFTPELRCEAADVATSISLVAAGLGFAFVQPSAVKKMRVQGIILRELPWFSETVAVHAAWRTSDASVVLDSLLRCLNGKTELGE